MASDKRDEFPGPVRDVLWRRVSGHCSNPGCDDPTSGPHTNEEKSVNLGVAAHITAAAPGGPRFDPSLTPAERKSVSNGIWLCCYCSNRVDKDELRYSADLLRAWKREAEARADSRLGKPPVDQVEGSTRLHNPPTATIQVAPDPNSYQVHLGRRHRLLREKILGIDVRAMANFYGFEKTSTLHAYENGLDEFPQTAVKRLIDFFFVSPLFLQIGMEPLFRTFYLSVLDHDCRALLDAAFSPIIFCEPSFGPRDGLVYVVFWKAERGFTRMLRSDLPGSLCSDGGGRVNVQNLLEPLVALGIPWTAVPVIDTRPDDWARLEVGNWYADKPARGPTNVRASDVFRLWYGETKASLDRWTKRGRS